MHRFYLPPELCQGTSLTLEDGEAHHALHVVRVRPGENVEVLDGRGHVFHAEVKSLVKRSVELLVKRQEFKPPLPFQATLIQAIPKGKAFENIVQKATELGVARIIPVLTERVVVNLEDGSVETKMEKWRQVAIEAIKQCGSPYLPEFEVPIRLLNLLHREPRFDQPGGGPNRNYGASEKVFPGVRSSPSWYVPEVRRRLGRPRGRLHHQRARTYSWKRCKTNHTRPSRAAE